MIANSMLIDMEPKVVNTLLENRHEWLYNKEYSIINQMGSGNNWAYGFNEHGPSCIETVFDKLD